MESPYRAPRKLVQAEIPLSAGRLLSGGHARQASLTEEITVAQATESSSQVSVNNRDVQGTSAGTEEVETLKRLVSALEERAAGIESRFNEYRDMQEQESMYQKMQIMCLGMKLELLESRNQRLEACATEIRAAAEEFAVMRANLDALQSKFRKVRKQSKQEFGAIDGRILALDAREADMAMRCQGFEQLMEEMKQLVLQTQKEKGTNSENVEVVVESSMRKLSSSKDVLEVLRDRWAADMEELIYLGWITAWLQHDLLASDSEGGTAKGTAVTGDDDGETIPTAEGQREKGMKMVAAAAPSNEVKLCKTSSCGAA
ncbi:hypothetical protein VPH35_074065 [Triticum aestivum]|uniref:uncharacterized protein n=1 Tax=Triticum aestivum TaxID=4565 RepID=UPI0008438968|nr:uncharacterized protein LOC123095069 [Triticum aestivum]